MANEDSQQEVDLSCTVCEHSLDNNANFLICQHPVIPVAVCICCKDIIDSRMQEIITYNIEDEDLEEYCCWCMDGGTLFLCDQVGHDGSVISCHHSFCRDCILTNLGEQYVKSIENSSSWACFVCDSTPLKTLTKAMKKGQELSIYHESFSNDANVSFNCIEDKEAATDIARLRSILGESEQAGKMLDPDHMNEKEKEIREELSSSSCICRSISSLVQEEVEVYRNLWKRQLDIIQRQEADLCEKVTNHGYDVTDTHIYDTQGKIERQEREMGVDELAACTTNIMKRLEEENHAANERAKMEGEDLRWEEEIDSLMKIDDEVHQDPIVQKYERCPLLKYPDEYRTQIPAPVLKALCYCVNENEREHLGQRFSIPAHIRIVLKYLRRGSPVSTACAFADMLPRHVCKAFRNANEKLELPILCDAYLKQYRDEICSSTDIIGTTDEAYDMYCLTKAEWKHGNNDKKIEKSEMETVEEEEQRMNEKDGTGQGFRINSKYDDDEDEREIKEQRRCLHTTYYNSTSLSLSNANDGPSANQSQADPQQLDHLPKRKYDDLEPPTAEEDVVRKRLYPTIEFVDLTGDGDD
eukprot:gene33443-44789_t